MGFTKTELRRILSGVEGITAEHLSEICELHIETQTSVVAEEVKKNKVDVKKSEEYLELDNKYKELAKAGKVDIKETEEYKSLQGEFDAFKKETEDKAKVTKSNEIKRVNLEKLGLKGSALELLLKDNFEFEFNDKGEVSNLEAYTKSITETYADLIPKELGKDGAKPSGKDNSGAKIKNINEYSYNELNKINQENPELYKQIIENKGE